LKIKVFDGLRAFQMLSILSLSKQINAAFMLLRASRGKQESPAAARVARDSSACIPPSWIFEISKLHH